MKNLTRRRMVTAIGTAGAGTCVCGLNSGCSTFSKKGNTPAIPVGAYSVDKKKLSIDLSKVPQLAQIGGSVKIIDKKLNDRLIVVHSGEGEFVAVSILCTHRGCEVEYQHKDREFRCASLGHSKFRMDGTKIKGFAKGPLKKYSASLDSASENRLVIAL